jgi:hypothetical protein
MVAEYKYTGDYTNELGNLESFTIYQGDYKYTIEVPKEATAEEAEEKLRLAISESRRPEIVTKELL